jgi:secreted Zn-dependent insulinase-like peptidase
MDEHFELDVDDNDYKGKSYGGKNNKKLLIFIIFTTVICLILSIALILIFLIFYKEDFTVLMTNDKILKPYTYNLSSEVIKLKNGIKAILVSEPNSTSSGISILSYYGSALDVIQGFAHFSEHMAFRGSKNHRDNKLWTSFNYYGVINDAFTVMENTCFYISTEVYSIFEHFLDMISDTLKNPLLNSSVIKNEINVVNSEYLLSNRTDEFILNNILGELLNENHPIYKHLSVGNNKTLNEKSAEDMAKYLRAYFQQAFHPNNLEIALYSNKSIAEIE